MGPNNIQTNVWCSVVVDYMCDNGVDWDSPDYIWRIISYSASKKKKSETRMTASVPKQDQNT